MYAYFPRLAPVPDEEISLGVPFSHHFDVRCERRPRESLMFYHRYFEAVRKWNTKRDLVVRHWGKSREVGIHPQL